MRPLSEQVSAFHKGGNFTQGRGTEQAPNDSDRAR